MKKKSQASRGPSKRQTETARRRSNAAHADQPGKKGRSRAGAPESRASRETFPKRTQKPGDVGLANEPRPGLGTRADDEVLPPPNPARTGARRKVAAKATGLAPGRRKRAEPKAKPRATNRGYEEPRPEPREQSPDSYEHEAERSTGVSGHMGMT